MGVVEDEGLAADLLLHQRRVRVQHLRQGQREERGREGGEGRKGVKEGGERERGRGGEGVQRGEQRRGHEEREAGGRERRRNRWK